MDAVDLSFDQIKVGDTASFSRTWTEKDVLGFAELSGDENPLHLDEAYAKTTAFGQRLVYGMLLGSLCSTLVGMYLPGKKCLYLSQTLVFKKPVFIGDMVKVVGLVTSKSNSTKILSVSIVMKKDEVIVVEGQAQVRIM